MRKPLSVPRHPFRAVLFIALLAGASGTTVFSVGPTPPAVTAVATSPDSTFATSTAPTITAVSVLGVTTSEATITWITGEACDSQVEYGATTDYGGFATLDSNLVTSHSQSLTGLAARTLYHFRVRSRNRNGDLVTSGNFLLYLDEVSFAWDASAGAEGYTVYYGTASGHYQFSTPFGNTTTGTVVIPAPGTYYFVVKARAVGVESGPSNEVQFTTSMTLKRDGSFDGDGRTDILWRNSITGQLDIWLMDGINAVASESPGMVADLGWEIVGLADFDGDGRTDILWHHAKTGMLNVWLMNGTNAVGGGSPGTVADLEWHIEGIGDFNGDGKADILWRHQNTGQLSIWLMDGTSATDHGYPGTVANLGWQIEGVADFNGDGRADILWRDTAGQLNIWFMDGINPNGNGSPGAVTDPGWQIEGLADFNGDGKADILWRHSTTGQLHIWLMDGTSADVFDSLAMVADLGWQIQTVGDFNGDGKTDILWRHSTSGQLFIWLMFGLDQSSSGSPGTVTDLTWRIAESGASTTNIAANGAVSVSSENVSTGQLGIKAVDGVVDGHPGDYRKEWVTLGQLAGAWIRLSWSSAVTVSKVVLYDRPNTTENITAGTLSFSDGSSIAVGQLPNNGAALATTFSGKTITWVQFTVTGAVGSNIGLAEIQVYGKR